MRHRVIHAAKVAAALAAGFGIVVVATAVLVGVALTSEDINGTDWD